MDEIAFSSRLATPERIRELQRRLYCKAKQDKAYRFYSLSLTRCIGRTSCVMPMPWCEPTRAPLAWMG